MITAVDVEVEVQRIYLEFDHVDRKVEIAVKVLAQERIKAARYKTWGEARIVSIRHAAAKRGDQ